MSRQVKLADLRVVELRSELERRNLDKTGVKAVLVERLTKALDEAGENSETIEVNTSCSEDVRRAGRSSTGSKSPSVASMSSGRSPSKQGPGEAVPGDDEGSVSEEPTAADAMSEVPEVLELGEDEHNPDTMPEDLDDGGQPTGDGGQAGEEEDIMDSDSMIEIPGDEEGDNANDEDTLPEDAGEEEVAAALDALTDDACGDDDDNVDVDGEEEEVDGDEDEDDAEQSMDETEEAGDDVSVVFDSADTGNVSVSASPKVASPSSPASGNNPVMVEDDDESTAAEELAADDAPGTPTQDEGTVQSSSLLASTATSYLLDDDDIDRQVLDYDVEGITIHVEDDKQEKAKSTETPATVQGPSSHHTAAKSSTVPVNKDTSSSSSSTSSAKQPAAQPAKGKDAANRNLWISGLGPKVRAAELKAKCGMYGTVLTSKIVTNPRSRGRVFGFVVMSSSAEANRCISAMHRTTFQQRLITVEKAKADPSKAAPKRPSAASAAEALKKKATDTPSTSSSKSSDSAKAGSSSSSGADPDRVVTVDQRGGPVTISIKTSDSSKSSSGSKGSSSSGGGGGRSSGVKVTAGQQGRTVTADDKPTGRSSMAGKDSRLRPGARERVRGKDLMRNSRDVDGKELERRRRLEQERREHLAERRLREQRAKERQHRERQEVLARQREERRQEVERVRREREEADRLRKQREVERVAEERRQREVERARRENERRVAAEMRAAAAAAATRRNSPPPRSTNARPPRRRSTSPPPRRTERSSQSHRATGRPASDGPLDLANLLNTLGSAGTAALANINKNPDLQGVAAILGALNNAQQQKQTQDDRRSSTDRWSEPRGGGGGGSRVPRREERSPLGREDRQPTRRDDREDVHRRPMPPSSAREPSRGDPREYPSTTYPDQRHEPVRHALPPREEPRSSRREEVHSMAREEPRTSRRDDLHAIMREEPRSSRREEAPYGEARLRRGDEPIRHGLQARVEEPVHKSPAADDWPSFRSARLPAEPSHSAIGMGAGSSPAHSYSGGGEVGSRPSAHYAQYDRPPVAVREATRVDPRDYPPPAAYPARHHEPRVRHATSPAGYEPRGGNGSSQSHDYGHGRPGAPDPYSAPSRPVANDPPLPTAAPSSAGGGSGSILSAAELAELAHIVQLQRPSMAASTVPTGRSSAVGSSPGAGSAGLGASFSRESEAARRSAPESSWYASSASPNSHTSYPYRQY